MADFLETERQNHANGDPVAVHLAALFCLTNNRPVPEWAVRAVEAMVRNDMDNAPDRGRGVAAPSVAAFRRQRDISIYEAVEIHRRWPGETLRSAQAYVQKVLKQENKRLAANHVVGAYQREAKRRPDQQR